MSGPNPGAAPPGHPVAAIDCGTNSTRLLVRGPDGATLDRRMRITRLGAGVDASGRLDPAAIDRVRDALVEYRAAMDAAAVPDGAVRVAATSAVRDASNRSAFAAMVREVVGVEPEVLTGDEEARLSFAGATADLTGVTGPVLVVDIGGGSTEFALGRLGPDGARYEGGLSTDMGCVRVTEAYLHADPPGPEELSAALSVIELHLDDVTAALGPDLGDATFVGLAGTVTTAAAVEIGLATYDRDRIHHFHLTGGAAEDVFRTLATEALEDRVHNPGLERERADVIVGGLCVLVSIFRRWGFGSCLVSEADILDGLAASVAASAAGGGPGSPTAQRS